MPGGGGDRRDLFLRTHETALRDGECVRTGQHSEIPHHVDGSGKPMQSVWLVSVIIQLCRFATRIKQM